MMEVIPAILANTFQEVEKKIRLVESYVDWIQIDVSDGTFTPNITWNRPEELTGKKFSVNFEAHLMITDPASQISKWAASGFKRVIIHAETVPDNNYFFKTVQICRALDLQLGLALNPKTKIEVVERFAADINLILVLAVEPGFSGQKFQGAVLGKIQSLREKFPAFDIEVDGGINPDTAELCASAGANIVAAGSYIFGSKAGSTGSPQDVKKAIEELKSV